MKCKHAQRGLLSTSGPRKLAADILAHLETCPVCKAWQVRLQEIDRAVPRLPVPDSADAKAAVIEQFLAEPATLAFRKPWWQHGSAWQRAIFAAAAGLLLLAILGQVFRGSRSPAETAPPPDPILAQLLNRNLAFAKFSSAQKKVETFAALAQDLENETRNLARVAGAAELNTLAELYEDVVSKGLLVQADEVQDDREKILLPIAEQLYLSSRSVAQFADDVPPAAKPSLTKIAAVAAKANQSLRTKTAAILKENKVASDTPPPLRECQS